MLNRAASSPGYGNTNLWRSKIHIAALVRIGIALRIQCRHCNHSWLSGRVNPGRFESVGLRMRWLQKQEGAKVLKIQAPFQAHNYKIHLSANIPNAHSTALLSRFLCAAFWLLINSHPYSTIADFSAISARLTPRKLMF